MSNRSFGLAAVGVVLALCFFSVAAFGAPLTSFDFNIVGLGLKADPAYQAVPKGIATQVNTGFDAGGFDLTTIIDKLPKDYTVRAELTGPAFQTPRALVTHPGSPFDIPTLALLGKYTLSNIRLVDGAGNTLFGATPQAVTIESINDPLITEVATRPLTLDELEERGVVFDSSNFTAYEFTAAIATESGQVPFNLPVLIPNGNALYNPDLQPPPSSVGLSPPSDVTPPPRDTNIPEGISLSGFMMGADVKEGDPVGSMALPPIPGILVIPGNIGFLHQYFSALAIVSNGAPGMSNLVVKDLQARLILPEGEDLTAGTDAAPGDDPLRMAKGAEDFFPRALPVVQAGPDGKFGTADDISELSPAESGQADFTIEGLKEGTHKLDFEITATLEGLPIGPVALKGRATGAVLVRNPDFAVTLGHPATVRTGEAYDLFVTITNTGKSIANLVSMRLDPRALSGAVFAGDENPDKQIETILPGSSGTVKYRLISQRTGKVTATAIASEDVQGRFILRTGVGELGIPLSPDSLILPYTDKVAPELVNATVGLLGQAWSVATAPSGALPVGVLSIRRQTVSDRANDLSETGLRLLIGDTSARATGDLVFDLLGSDSANVAFDDLRRRTTQGVAVNEALGAVLGEASRAQGELAFQGALGQQATSRTGHLSVITSEAPLRLQLSDDGGARTGGLAAGEAYREIPYGDVIPLSKTGASRSDLLVLSRLESATYRLDLQAVSSASFDLGVVLPGATGELRQVRFAGVSLPAGSRATATLVPNSNAEILLFIDVDGDGAVDSTLASSSTLVIPDQEPQLLAATQIVPGFGPGGDVHGRTVALLFSEEVSKESAQDIANYGVEENGVRIAYLQPGGRMVFILLRDGIGPFFERDITIGGLVDLRGNVMSPATRPIVTTATGPAAILRGTVRAATGGPVPGATVRLMQLQWVTIDFEFVQRYFIISEKPADADGKFQFDYVFRNDDPFGPFMIQAVHPETNEAASLTTSVAYHGQEILLDLFMKARGSISGRVLDAAGVPVAAASVLLKTLTDNRSYMNTSDATGGFAFSGVSVGPFSLKGVSQTLFAEGSTMGTLPDDGGSVTQDVTIYPVADVARGNLTGKVTGADGTPRPGVVVIAETILGQSIPYQNWMRSDAEGNYGFTGVFAGNVRVRVRDDATGEQGTVTGLLAQGETRVFNVILSGTGTVSGSVRREDGAGVEGLYVAARVNSSERYTQVDAAGHFEISGLPTGDVFLRVPNPANYNASLASATVTLLAAGDTAQVDLFIPASALVSGAIRGTVYRLDGSVAPFAEVRRLNRAQNSYYPTKADGEGRFEITDLSKGSSQLVVVNGREISNTSADILFDGQVKEVALHPAGIGTVTGTVYDEGSGMMPVGADVRLYGVKPDLFGWLVYDTSTPVATMKSDPQSGRYTVTGVYAGSFSVQASNIFRPLASVAGKVAKNNETVVADLILRDTFGSISGEVLLPDGSPAGEGVRVWVSFDGAEVAVTTDPEGKFAFRPIIPAKNYEVTAEDLLTTLKVRQSVKVQAGVDLPLTLRLLGRGEMTVKALNPDGTAESGATVSIKGNAFPNDNATAVTGSDGTVHFENLSEGGYSITATAFPNRGGRVEGVIPGDQVSVAAEVLLSAYGTVTGRFLKADGVTPVGGGQVKLLNLRKEVLAYAISSSDPAAPGEFRFDYIPLGDFTLEGFDPLTERIARGGGRVAIDGQTVTANLMEVPRGTVKGVILNYGGSAPVGSAPVTLTATGTTSYGYAGVAAPDGTFLFAGVPAGSFRVSATDPTNGLRGEVTGTLSYEGETVQSEVRIAPSGGIAGKVFLPDGITPAVNVTVRNQTTAKLVLVDPVDGSFGFTDLAAGRSYSLLAKENNSNRAASVLVSVATDGMVGEAEIVLRGIGTVQGTVLDTDGVNPLPGAMVTLFAQGTASASYTAFSSADGGFRFTNVPASSFTLRATHPQRTTAAAATGTLSNEGDVVTLNLPFADVGTVQGRVLMPDGVTPASGGTARLSGGGSFVAVVDAEGGFIFADIPLCSFTITFEDPSGLAINKASGLLDQNGEVVDLGTLVLDDKAIAVVQVDPAPGSVDVPIATPVKIKFSEPAKVSTVTSSTVKVLKGTEQVAGALTLDGDGAGVTFVPSQPLSGFTLYTVVVTTGLRDLVDRAMGQIHSSTFTTVDNIPPAVSSISPVHGSIQVAPEAVVRVTFSETIDPDSLGNMLLLKGGAAVETRIDLVQNGKVAVVTPLAPLATNAFYSVKVSGVRDLVGNAMVGTTLGNFTTVDTIAPTVSTLTVPETAKLIASSSVTATATVAEMDVSFVDFFVDNRLVGTDISAPFSCDIPLGAPGLAMVKAIAQDKVGNRGIAKLLDLTVVPDQAPTVAITSPVTGGELATGRIFTVTVQASDDVGLATLTLTASGALDYAQTLVATGTDVSRNFTLTAPAAATPGSTILLGVTATDTAGQPASASSVTLVVRDHTPPALTLTSPGQTVRYRPGESGTATVVAADSVGVAQLDCSVSGAASGDASWSLDPTETSLTREFAFAVAADADAHADIVIGCSASDTSSNSSAISLVLKTADVVAPVITGASLSDGAVDVPVNSSLTVTFNEALTPATVNGATVFLSTNAAVNEPVSGQISLSANGRIVTFAPASPLLWGATYQLTLLGTIEDAAGNPLGQDYTLRFATLPPDVTPPTIVNAVPGNGTSDVSVSGYVVVTFSEPIAATSVLADSLSLGTADGLVAGSSILSADALTLVFSPTAPLEYGRVYTVTVKAGLADASGNLLADGMQSIFRTTASIDLLKAVYFDSRYAHMWSNSVEAANYRDFLVANGFVSLDADELAQFMTENGPNSLVFMAQDLVPETVIADPTDALIRQYMNRGGTVVWNQYMPFYYIALSKGGLSASDSTRSKTVLGVTPFYPGTYTLVTLTDAGIELGLSQIWNGGLPVMAEDVTTVLATSPLGDAAAWFKNFNPEYPDSGFYRIWDYPGDFNTRSYLKDLLTITKGEVADVADSGLVARYHVDRNWADASGNNLDGTVVGAVPYALDSAIGYASGDFSAASNHVAIGGLSGLFPNKTFSIEAWVKLDDTGSGQRQTIAGGVGTNRDYAIGLYADQFVAFAGDGEAITYAYSGFTPQLGEWYHLVGSYDGSDLRLYVNGESVGTQAVTWKQPTSNADFWLGNAFCCQDNEFNGLIDEVGIYNRALSDLQVLDHYNVGLISAGGYPTRPNVTWSASQPEDLATLLKGTKDADAAILVDGIELVPVDGLRNWTAVYATEPGRNIIQVSSRNVFGKESGSQTVYVLTTEADLPLDYDGDGMTNGQEVANGTDPMVDDAYKDPDQDGLTNLEETSLGTDPFLADTDADGLADGVEVREQKTDPLNVDSDGDTLSDGEEVLQHQSAPLLFDTDGDGLDDGWEVRYGYSPISIDSDGNGVLDGEEDPDGDGLINIWEYKLGLDPMLVKTDGKTADGQRDGDRDGWKNIDEVAVHFTDPTRADTDGDGVIDPDEKNILLTDPNDKADLDGSDFVLDGKTIRIEGAAVFNSLTLLRGAVITALDASSTQISRIEILVNGELAIDGSSKIDVSSRGYLGGAQQDNSGNYGRTLGNTVDGGSNTYSGGSYGGYGGQYSSYAVGAVYGDLADPNVPGSGGGGNSSYHGGNGGGLVRIVAGHLELQGAILADGMASLSYGGGGSGGAIWIDVGTLVGTGGQISAKGGTSANRGAGGGGRVAVYYDTLSLSRENIHAGGGMSGAGTTAKLNGGAGTVYLKAHVAAHGDLTLDNDGVTTDQATPVPGGDYADVKVIGGARLAMADTVTTEADMVLTDSSLSVIGNLVLPGNLTLHNSDLVVGGGLSLPGDLSVTGSAITVNGSLVVGGALSLVEQSLLTHAYATSMSESRLEIQATSISVDATSKIDVSARGYLGAGQQDNRVNYGRTLGNTLDGGSYTYSGGSYGGYGGQYGSSAVGTVYGDLADPNVPGSGGGGDWTFPGGNGGGRVRIVAGRLELQGAILADGMTGLKYYGSGGSGGAIWIDVGTLAGTGGQISAKGGTSANGGAGGGGRVAVYYDTLSLSTENIHAGGGMSGAGTAAKLNGGAGTVYLKSHVAAHGDLTLDNDGVMTDQATPVPGGDYADVKVIGGARLAMTDAVTTEADMVLTDSSLSVVGNLTLPGNLTLHNSELFVGGGLSLPGNLSVTGSGLTVNGSLVMGGALSLLEQSLLTHAYATSVSESRLEIQAASIVIDASSKIDVSGRGYLGGFRGDNGSQYGRTLGNTVEGGSAYYSGGSYGGKAGSNAVNAVYGDLADPAGLGSGGGGGYFYYNRPGGSGGGLVRIVAGSLELEGAIVADGMQENSNSGGGGGGGIRIDVGVLSGTTGQIHANGGSSPSGGAGGGGRIAVYYDTLSLSTENIRAGGGISGAGTTAKSNGGAGTVYLKSRSAVSGALIVDNGGVVTEDHTTPLLAVGQGLIQALTFDSMSSSGANWKAGALKGLRFKPNATKEQIFTVVDNDAGTLFIDFTEGDLTQVAQVGASYSGVYSFDHMWVLGKAQVRCLDQIQISDELLIDDASLVVNDISAEDITLKNGGILSPWETTTNDVYSLDLKVRNALFVELGSSIDASACGYLGSYQGGNNSSSGRTLGNTTIGGSDHHRGASYGGLGGISAWTGIVNGVYGDPLNPDELGSGAGGESGNAGGSGGGLVRIRAGSITLDGVIAVNGGNATYGGGSGGGIRIDTDTLSGDGSITAVGGSGTNANGGAGGGGRIAIYSLMLDFPFDNISVLGGISGTGGTAPRNGQPGTLYLQ